jgi:hypothetical protein
MGDEAILNLNMLDFVFERHHDIELEGYALAGVLIIDFPKSKRRVPDRAQRMANPIILHLIMMVRAGQLPYDAKVYGWKDDIWPPNSDEITENKAVIKAWADKRVCIGVRASTDGRFPVDSHMLQQMGLAARTPSSRQ